MESFVLKGKEYLAIEEWENNWPNLVVGFSTKNGGLSKGDYSTLNMGFHVGDNSDIVCQNKQTIASIINFPLNNWVAAEQTHGINIKKVTSSDLGSGSFQYDDSILNTDGYYTNETGILLTLCFADCVPIYFIDDQSKMIGIVHAGWKGTVNGITREFVNTWRKIGIQKSNIKVAIGPSICKNCYIVDDYVINFVEKTLEDVEKKPYNLIKANQYHLDLSELNKQILIRYGIRESNILVTNYCTSCHSELFFSYRRDSGQTGRMMSFIGWKED
ncbi:peptidoglycan editing factor PgeF [Pseudoneobacillus sp. C159]